MALQDSTLANAVHQIAAHVHNRLGLNVEVDNPARAWERMKDEADSFLTFFVYRIAPSGFHAQTFAPDPCYVRIYVLITPFFQPVGDADSHAGLINLLGNVIWLFHEDGVISIPTETDPARAGDPIEVQVQAVLQAPSMEEINHIWTTQGGDLAYRPSVVYEFALIPVEPVPAPARPPAPRAIDVRLSQDLITSADAGQATDAAPDLNPAPVLAPAVGPNGELTPAWLPWMLFVQAPAADPPVMMTTLEIAADAPPNHELLVALAGPPNHKVDLVFTWSDDNTPRIIANVDLKTFSLTDAAGRRSIELSDARPAGAPALVAGVTGEVWARRRLQRPGKKPGDPAIAYFVETPRPARLKITVTAP